MERTKLNVPASVAYCRGTSCNSMSTCEGFGCCTYKSSADLYREMQEQMQAGSIATIGEPAVTLAAVPDVDENNRQVEMFDAGVVKTVPAIRQFSTGASRDTDSGKFDYEGFLSPLVLKRFAEYMHKNRQMRDGSLRDSDNWQKGIPLVAYMKSMWRHFMAVWSGHRSNHDVEEDLCAMLFNVQGYLHEVLKAQ